MNVMLACPTGDIFLGSIDMTGNKKTKAYIATELKKFIEDVGPRFVTQICTDNATNMLGAMDDIVMTYPHISKQGCAMVVTRTFSDGLTDDRTMAAGASVTWTHCSVLFEVTWG
jgi:hypothetical protein